MIFGYSKSDFLTMVIAGFIIVGGINLGWVLHKTAIKHVITKSVKQECLK